MADQATITNDTNELDLFSQIRTAHRLLAAYYQRLLPTIDEIANSLELDFYGWHPSEHGGPCRFSSNIMDRWQWDLLPANCTRYVFFNAEKKNEIRVGKYMIEFHVISDSGILTENWKSPNIQPDALDLSVSVERAQSVLRVHLYAPYKNRDAYWYDGLFDQCEDPVHTVQPEANKVADNVHSFISGFEMPLAELIADDAVVRIVERIKQFRDNLLEHVSKEDNP